MEGNEGLTFVEVREKSESLGKEELQTKVCL